MSDIIINTTALLWFFIVIPALAVYLDKYPQKRDYYALRAVLVTVVIVLGVIGYYKL